MSYLFTPGTGSTMYCQIYGSTTSLSAGDNINVTKLAVGADGVVTMVTAAAPMPVQHGNGTQTMPSGDAAARPIYMKITDGTNTLSIPASVNPSANFTRPSDTTAYTSGDLVANSVTAGSVTPMSWTAPLIAAGAFKVRRARLKKSGLTATNGTFRLHLYAASPTIANGDNAAWSTTESTYLGSFDLDMTASTNRLFSDANKVIAAPSVGTECTVKLASGQTIYGLLEARAAYTPASAEVFTVELEIDQI